MESQSAPQQHHPLREAPGGGKPGSGSGNVFCKCGEGWTCVITRTVGPDAGKVFFKCGDNCTCSIDGEEVREEGTEVGGDVGSGAYCKCGEGWSCVISRTEPPLAPKGFECTGPCTCTIDAK